MLSELTKFNQQIFFSFFIMVHSCSAFGCQNRDIGASDIRFHSFPTRDPELRRKWIQAVRRVNFNPTSADKLCSEHFLPSDYRQESHLERKLLKNGAVPSIFPAFPSHLQPPAKKRRILERVPVVAANVEVSQIETVNEPSTSTIEPEYTAIIPPPRAISLSEIVLQDHSYSFPSSIEAAKEKCDTLQKHLL